MYIYIYIYIHIHTYRLGEKVRPGTFGNIKVAHTFLDPGIPDLENNKHTRTHTCLASVKRLLPKLRSAKLGHGVFVLKNSKQSVGEESCCVDGAACPCLTNGIGTPDPN